MKLVLQVAPRKFVPIQVNEDWTARVEIPKGMDVPRNFNSRSGSIEFRAASHRSSDAGMRLVGPVSPWTKRSDQGGSRSR